MELIVKERHSLSQWPTSVIMINHLIHKRFLSVLYDEQMAMLTCHDAEVTFDMQPFSSCNSNKTLNINAWHLLNNNVMLCDSKTIFMCTFCHTLWLAQCLVT